MTDERAVSEVIGFILVFTLVLGTISFVYVGGFASLQDTRDNEQMANAERAFDVLANNLLEIGRGKAPSRATEIKLSDARLTMDQRYRLNVTVDGSGYVSAPRTMTYHGSDNSKVVYEHGAVFRQEVDGAAMIREPDFIISEDRTVIRHLEIRGGSLSVGGSTTVLVRAEANRQSLLHPQPGDDMNVSTSTLEIRLQTAPQRTAAWKRYLESKEPVTSCNVLEDVPDLDTHQTVVCDLDTASLAISETTVDVTFH